MSQCVCVCVCACVCMKIMGGKGVMIKTSKSKMVNENEI